MPGLDGFADQFAAAGGGKIVAVVPAQRLVLDAEIVEAALERLELAVGLAEEVEPDLVEIPQAAIDRQIAAPIVGVARQRHAGARTHRGDAIGTGSDRSGHRGFLERREIDGVLRQDRHQPEDQRQFAVVGAGEIEAHRERIERLGLGDLGVVLAMVGAALVAQQRPGEQHVLGRDRLAVGEARAGIEAEGDVSPGVVGLDGLGEQAVERERLVIAARHQALDDEAPHLLHGKPAHDQRIEAVEGSGKPQTSRPPLGAAGLA